MSLLRLLTAGRSLVGLKKAEVRYHLLGQQALPRFGSKKNPFRATVLPERCEPAAENRGQAPADKAAAEPSGSTPSESRGGDGGIAAQSDSAKELASNGSRQEQEGTSEEKQRSRGSAVKAFLLWGRARKAQRSASGKALVQGELSLDRVRVVRNDLSESDLEVVPAGHPTAAKVPVSRKVSEAKPANSGSGLGVSAGRLLGLGKM